MPRHAVPWLAIQSFPVPVKDPVSGVRVLLDFKNHEARSERVDPPTRQEHHVALLHGQALHTFRHGPFADASLEFLAGDAPFQAHIQLRSGGRFRHIPQFHLRLAAQLRGFSAGG